MYTAAVLSLGSIARLTEVILENVECEKFQLAFETSNYSLPHHMTINLGSFDEKLNSREILGQKVLLLTNTIAVDNELGVCAVPVICAPNNLQINCFNKQPHITCCLRQNVKPKTSNDLFLNNKSTQFIQIEQMELDAMIMICQ